MELSIFAILFCVGLAGAGLWFFAKSRTSEASAMPVGKPLSWFSLAGSFVAAQIGGSSILYTVECAQTDGIFAILYPLGSALGLLALGLGLGARIARLQISSVPDLFVKHYGSETLKKISCYLSIASILGLLAAQAVALKGLFRGLGLERDTLFISAWIAIVFFTLRGKSKMKSRTAIAQAMALLAILSGVCFFSPLSPTKEISFFGSFSGMHHELMEGMNSKLSAYLLMPCFFMFLEPQMVQSSLQVRSKKDISVAVIFSGLILLLCSFIPVYYGIAGKTLGVDDSTSELLRSVDAASSPFLTVFSAAFLLIALVSGASTLLQSLNTHLLKDLSHSKRPKFSFHFSWGWTLVLGMLALVFSYMNFGLASLILESYELVVVCMLIPLVQAACGRKDVEYPKLAAALSMCFGAIGFCLCRFYSISFFPEAFSLLLSWFGFILGKALCSSQNRKLSRRAKDDKNVDCQGLRCN